MSPPPPGREAQHILHSGRQVTTHPALPENDVALRAMYARCSAESLYARYRTASPTPSAVPGPVHRSGCTAVTLVAHPAEDPGQLIAAAELVGLTAGREWEAALLVEDAWQGCGLGTVLAAVVLDAARARGATTVTASVALSNGPALRLVNHLGGRPRPPYTIEAVFDIPVDPTRAST